MCYAWLAASPVAFAYSLFNLSKILRIQPFKLTTDFVPAFFSSLVMFFIVRFIANLLIVNNISFKLPILVSTGVVSYLIFGFIVFKKKFTDCYYMVKNIGKG